MPGARPELRYGAELLGLCGLVITQPVLSVFAAAPEELTAIRASPLAIVVFALTVALAPALVLWLLEQPARLWAPDRRDAIHRVVLGALAGILAIEVAKAAARPPSWLLIVLGVVTGVGFAVLVGRREQARLVVRYLALAPVAFVALFLFASPVSVLVVGGGAEAAEVEVREPAPVLMVVLDELPTASLLDGAGDLDRGRLPGFAAVAEDAIWYRNHTTVAPLTPSAVPAILTGQVPTELQPAPVAAQFPDNLFTLLAESHDLRVDEPFTRLCPETICDPRPGPSDRSTVSDLLGTARQVFGSLASPRAERADLSFVVPTEPDDPAAVRRLEALAERVGQPTASGRPPLDFVHALLPHQPFERSPTDLRYDAPDPPRGAEFGTWFDDDSAAIGQQRHLWQLELTDALLADVIEGLRASGTYDETLIIVTADHGISFSGGEPIRGVSADNAHEILWTPLFVKPPDRRGATVDDGRVETVDVLSTIAEILDVMLPYEVDGTSRLDGGGPPDLPARVLDWSFSSLRPENGDLVIVDAVDGYERLLAAAPPGAGGDDPLAGQRIGPHGDLVGMLVEDVTVGAPVDVDLKLVTPSGGFAVTAGAGEIPAYVSGLYGEDVQGWAALALDGEIVAVAQAYEAGDDQSDISALLPPERLTPGDHELEVFVIAGEGDDRVLRSAGAF